MYFPPNLSDPSALTGETPKCKKCTISVTHWLNLLCFCYLQLIPMLIPTRIPRMLIFLPGLSLSSNSSTSTPSYTVAIFHMLHFSEKYAVSGFPVSPGSAQAQLGEVKKMKHLLIV